jgi:catechol 2,3-dioxygenase-like lactoylglutathione lyase family enzyme
MVEDQAQALDFYTRVLGFRQATDIDLGEARWLTVTSPEGAEGVELLLEPVDNPQVPAREFQAALKEAGIPWTSFGSSDVQAEYERLKARGVVFTSEPAIEGGVTTAVFDDTCGNLIMLAST